MLGFIPSFGDFMCFHPPVGLCHPRVATYIASSVAREFTVLSPLLNSPHLVEVNLFALPGICSWYQKDLRVLNLYNPLVSSSPPASGFPLLCFFPGMP